MDTVDSRIIAMLQYLTVEQKEEVLRQIRDMAMYEPHRTDTNILVTPTKCK